MKTIGTEKEFTLETGSPISITLADNNILKKTAIEIVIHRYRDDNKDAKFCKQIPADFEYENNKQKTLITERDDITPLLGLDWMKKFNLTIRNVCWEENNQSEKGSDLKVPGFGQE